MSNHPNRTPPPADLAGALVADMDRTGESLRAWARRRDVPFRTAEGWMQGRGTGAMARLLAEEIRERLKRAD